MIPTRRATSATAVLVAFLLVVTQSVPLMAQDGSGQYRVPRPARTVAEVLLLTAQEQAAAVAPDTSDLTITVLEGENGVNIIKKKTAVKPVVEVRDKHKLPVSGAAVTSTLPSVGAGGTFANGSRVLTVLTDASGRAAVTSVHPVGAGAFKIGVTATLHGHMATVAIAQTNYLNAAAASAAGASAGSAGAAGGGAAAGGLSGLAIGGIVAGVVTAAVVAAKVATGGKSSSTTSPSGPSATIGLGSGPTLGPPH